MPWKVGNVHLDIFNHLENIKKKTEKPEATHNQINI